MRSRFHWPDHVQRQSHQSMPFKQELPMKFSDSVRLVCTRGGRIHW
ncbi:hypothetical protein RSSM_05452 [Rhodopirellula sallentina SM41]|uniref:Uncharacterized protein n=2 Tax=Rhodopirellula TaxID=265488 RepID=M5TVB3_9BACT|nr:hypothetical protein RE6C_01431 [Rhodopirellula europaea 6C]EMI53110.1 hypothetical protein RSSM_05452 [Rhodopirellula sallentina SM41]